MSKKPRFPIPRYPRGWFQVAYADEIQPGEVQPLKYFGVELVMFRTEDGEVSVLDAFCPHMGAHLGHGGKVDGDGIVCPFHAWKFNGEGKCTEVPYAKHLPRKANITAWPVIERNGLIMVWHDIDGKEPEWDIPEIPEWNNEAWTPYWRQRWKMRTHNQDMCENVVDKAHFRYVHGMNIVPQPHTVDLKYPEIHMVTDTAMETPRGDVTGELEVNVHGFGFSLSRFRGIVETTNMASVTPIDDEYCDVRFSFTVKKLGGADITAGVGKAFTNEVARQLEEDAPIWENKAFFQQPMLCDGDGPVAEFRKWCKDFYPEWYHKQAQDEYDGVKEVSKPLTLAERRKRLVAA